eukprot:m51a1_g5808 hypothetical protein (271) ;mRNA; f:139174-139986
MTVIGITYRLDKEGAGWFWDHYTIQKVFCCETVTLMPPELRHSDEHGPVLCEYATKDDTFVELPFGNMFRNKRVPRFVYDPREVDLIVMPGSHPSFVDPYRNTYEEGLFDSGKPVLCLCGAVERIAARFPDRVAVEPVKNHTARQMVRLSVNNEKIVWNKLMHEVTLEGSWADFMAKLGFLTVLKVNSVHRTAATWVCPESFEVVARRSPDAKGQDQSDPCIEAFISRSPPLVMAFQWHPEAFCNEPMGIHRQMLTHFLSLAVPCKKESL